MSKVNVCSVVTAGDEPVAPIPSVGILGDTLYAQLVAVLRNENCAVAENITTVEHGYPVTKDTQELSGVEDIDDGCKLTRVLISAINKGSYTAKVIDKLLTDLINGLLTDRIVIDSFSSDYNDLVDMFSKTNSAVEATLYEDITILVDSVVKSFVTHIDSADDLCAIEYLTYTQKYFVFDNLLLELMKDISDDTYIISPETAPVIYKAIKPLLNESMCLCHLVTDGAKYTMASVKSLDKIVLRKV